MDERLIGQFDWQPIQPPALELCLYAVLLARLDLTPQLPPREGVAQNFINVRLGHILHLGFTTFPEQLFRLWDAVERLAVLSKPKTSQQRWRQALTIGDQALFITGLDLYPQRDGHPERERRAITSVGQTAYRIAGTHFAHDPMMADVYDRLVKDFALCQQLIHRAGHILGFNCELASLWTLTQPPLMLEDVLAAYSAFKQTGTLTAWEQLERLTAMYHWSHPDAVFTLPPRPTA